jgi:hypothetical protein
MNVSAKNVIREIEDEMHFLLLCNHFETDRENI